MDIGFLKINIGVQQGEDKHNSCVEVQTYEMHQVHGSWLLQPTLSEKRVCKHCMEDGIPNMVQFLLVIEDL